MTSIVRPVLKYVTPVFLGAILLGFAIQSLGDKLWTDRWQLWASRGLMLGIFLSLMLMVRTALANDPSLIVADEPVSMVDASLRAMILDIMLRLRDERGISFLYITHDLSTAYQIGDDIYLLYQGSTAEMGETSRVIEDPKHPYAQQLIGSIPVPDPDEKWDTDISLPDDEKMREQADSGCRFYGRCPHRWDKCLTAQPRLYEVNGGAHQAACYLYEEPSTT